MSIFTYGVDLKEMSASIIAYPSQIATVLSSPGCPPPEDSVVNFIQFLKNKKRTEDPSDGLSAWNQSALNANLQLECSGCSQGTLWSRGKTTNHRGQAGSNRHTASSAGLPHPYLCRQPTLHHPDVEMWSGCLVHFHTAVGNHEDCSTGELHISRSQRTKFY